MKGFEELRPRILAAREEAELVRVMAEFCARWLPSDLAKLPGACPKCEVASADAIPELAVAYTSAELQATDREVAEILLVLASAFVLALQQLRRLRPSANLLSPGTAG